MVKTMRPSKIQNYMDIAEVVANRSHDDETKVGSLLINNKNGAIIATGHNGFVRGASDKNLPTTRPEKYKYIVHSECNLIANCARLGIQMEDSTLICTLTPCANCMRLLYQCGITKVIAKEKYKDFESLLEMDDINIAVSNTQEGFLCLEYSAE